MSFLISLVIVLIASIFLWLHFFRAYHYYAPTYDETHYLWTIDDWRLTIHRYLPHEGAPEHKIPVLLVPGLGSNRYSFDVGSQSSMAQWLAARGHDVWVAELRGQGLSDKPRFFGNKVYHWNFDDFLNKDLKSISARILETTGAKSIHAIGHSLGGLLLLSSVTGNSPKEYPWSSVTSFGSAFSYHGGASVFHWVNGLKRIVEALPVMPLGLVFGLFTPFGARFSNRIDRINFWLPNIDKKAVRRLLAHNFDAVPIPLLQQLASALSEDGLKSGDGKTRYGQAVGPITAPIMVFAGDKDQQCDPGYVERTAEMLRASGAKVRVVIAGKASGMEEHYGHFDMIIGKRAATEIFPKVLEFLESSVRSS